MNYVKELDSDEKINARIVEIKVGENRIRTPCKAVEKTGAMGAVNEFAPHFNQEKLDQILSGNYGLKKSNSLTRIKDNYIDGAINTMIPTYEDVKITPRQMSKMASLQYAHSDMMAIPRWEGVLKARRPDMTDNIIQLTKDYVESMKRNGKMIVGNLPRVLPFNSIERIMDVCYDLGITSFVIDCCNTSYRTNLDVQIDIQKKLMGDGMMETSFLHSINVKKSTTRNNDLIPADDFLMFGHGIDLIGSMHISPGGGDPQFKTAKVFNRARYTYERQDGLTQNQMDMIRAKNYVIQNEETEIVRRHIEEEHTAYKLLEGKDGARASIEEMLKKSTQRTLLDIYTTA